MGLKIRLSRAGAKKRPYYHIVVADSRSPRDGRFIEKARQLQPDAAGRARRPHPPAVERASSIGWARARWRPTAWRASSAVPAWRRCPPARADQAVGAEEEGAGTRGQGRGLSGPSVPAARILMGVIGRPHGVRGLVRVRSYTADPADAGRATARWRPRTAAASACAGGSRASPRSPSLERRAGPGGRPHARRNGSSTCGSTPSAPTCRRRTAEEYYLADLVGLEAVDAAGRAARRGDGGARLRRRRQPGIAGRPRCCWCRSPAPRCRRWILAAGRVVMAAGRDRRGSRTNPSPRRAALVRTVRVAQSREPAMTWRASVLTLFPEVFPGPLGHSLAGRALEAGCGRWRRTTSAPTPPTATARWTTPRSAAAPAW